MSEIPQQNTFEDQRKQALELYENMVKECHHWSSFIQRAIESYNPELQAQISAKEQEIVNLERGIAGYSKEVSEPQKIASDQDSELSSLRAEKDKLQMDLKDMTEGRDYDKFHFEQECERLKDLINQNEREGIIYGSVNANAEINSLRKRCEDLEQKVISRDKIINNYGVKGHELQKRVECLEAVIKGLIPVCDPDNIDAFEAVREARRVLNQIKY